MTLRELCNLLGETLHLPGVGRWAAPLVRRILLPRSGCEVNALDVALLLAVVAAPRPADAACVVVTLAELPLEFVDRKVSSGAGALSSDLLEAINVARLAAAHGEDQCTVAIAQLMMAVRSLVIIGGSEATVETLEGVSLRIRQGNCPEPTHAAGHA